MAFLIGFFVSASIFLALNMLFPCHGMGEYNDEDVYGTFTAAEAAKLGVICVSAPEEFEGIHADEEAKTFRSEAVVEKHF